MNSIFSLAFKSLTHRRWTTYLTILSISLSVILLLGIERVRLSTRESFESTIAQVDLIVGARSSPVNLLLFSVFRIGDATNNVSFETFQKISQDSEVLWAIPISLGDSHRGYRVIGTNSNYFEHYRYSTDRNLRLIDGKYFAQSLEAVIGSDVARDLNYKVGDKITLSHGSGKANFQEHSDHVFIISGVLEKTNTPVDKSVHVSLEAIEAIHAGWLSSPGTEQEQTKVSADQLKPKAITAFFIRLRSKLGIFQMQRTISEYEDEALTAILPGVSLKQLWDTIGFAEKALFFVSILVFVVSLFSMLIALVTTLNERRREMAILRAVGAKPGFIFSLLIFEAAFLATSGIALGLALLYSFIATLSPVLENHLGMSINLYKSSSSEFVYLASIIISALVLGFFPAWRAYQQSLVDGLTIKV